MMRLVIVHRWSGNPQSDWYPWLKKTAEKKGYKVFVPEMPETDEPKIDAWVEHLKKTVGTVDAQTFFVGHSIGCQTIMRYVMTLPKNAKIGGMILVAGWFTLQNLGDTESEELTKPWTETPIDFVKVKEKTKKIVVFLSDNDPYVALEENADRFKKSLGAKVRVEAGKGHFTADDGMMEMPEVLEELEMR